MPKFRGNAKLTFTYEVQGIEVDAENEDAATDLIEEAAGEEYIEQSQLHLQDTDVEDVEEVDDEDEEDECPAST